MQLHVFFAVVFYLPCGSPGVLRVAILQHSSSHCGVPASPHTKVRATSCKSCSSLGRTGNPGIGEPGVRTSATMWAQPFTVVGTRQQDFTVVGATEVRSMHASMHTTKGREPARANPVFCWATRGIPGLVCPAETQFPQCGRNLCAA